MNIASIVPSKSIPGQPTQTSGTRVILADGTELDGVISVSIHAGLDGIWKANIECLVSFDDPRERTKADK